MVKRENHQENLINDRSSRKEFLSLTEKFSIFSHLLVDIIERYNLKQSTEVQLTENQFLILKILYVSRPKILKEIAEILSISNAAASKNINFLVNKKFVSRKMITFNRRTVKIMLLERGKSVVRNYFKIREEKMKSILKNLNEKQEVNLNLSLDNFIHACLSQEKNLSLFCLQCGGKYEERCPISKHVLGCYFQLQKS